MFPANRSFPKVPLIQTPTPLHRLSHLSKDLNLDLWIKRDDLTGFAMGGNKGRKLEYVIADALQKDAEVIVGCGSLQSNFIRHLAAACSVYGIVCAAALMDLPFNEPEDKPSQPGLQPTNGNALLDRILGADLRVFPDGTWNELDAHRADLVAEYQAKGKRVYDIPIGGSSALSAFAFVEAAEELKGHSFDWIVFASSSGSTQTGLSYAFHETNTNIQGIACDPEPEMVEDFVDLAAQLDTLLGQTKGLKADDFRWDLDSVGPGYGIPSKEGESALQLMARREGIFLDPIYTAKAFAGLIRLSEAGKIAGKVLFWHTGGTPALFALQDA